MNLRDFQIGRSIERIAQRVGLNGAAHRRTNPPTSFQQQAAYRAPSKAVRPRD